MKMKRTPRLVCRKDLSVSPRPDSVAVADRHRVALTLSVVTSTLTGVSFAEALGTSPQEIQQLSNSNRKVTITVISKNSNKKS
jgi:hypothetical protein